MVWVTDLAVSQSYNWVDFFIFQAAFWKLIRIFSQCYNLWLRGEDGAEKRRKRRRRRLHCSTGSLRAACFCIVTMISLPDAVGQRPRVVGVSVFWQCKYFYFNSRAHSDLECFLISYWSATKDADMGREFQYQYFVYQHPVASDFISVAKCVYRLVPVRLLEWSHMVLNASPFCPLLKSFLSKMQR